ncbi:pyoverdine biosynthesis protein [Pseudomonas chlororaphis]|uniref:Pyoverdine biosynthesis protein n=1 Tax=Pseudomonas chlororaphis TaxID=587753 RepID=A0A1Q8EKK8_9PSED|nr:pyoverdine biosynthesis protein [Pseudomonas chlororaphis]OLF52338.1 pyoverdine biosynthesis protein [Pseudomonas chlororaphis]
MPSFDPLSAVAIADTCRCAADPVGPPALRLDDGATGAVVHGRVAPLPQGGGDVLQALRGQAGQRDEWMAGWLSALVHSLYLDHEPLLVEAAGEAGDQQERCLHCQRPFDFSHKRAALLILAQGPGAERGRLVGEVWRRRS